MGFYADSWESGVRCFESSTFYHNLARKFIEVHISMRKKLGNIDVFT